MGQRRDPGQTGGQGQGRMEGWQVGRNRNQPGRQRGVCPGTSGGETCMDGKTIRQMAECECEAGACMSEERCDRICFHSYVLRLYFPSFLNDVLSTCAKRVSEGQLYALNQLLSEFLGHFHKSSWHWSKSGRTRWDTLPACSDLSWIFELIIPVLLSLTRAALLGFKAELLVFHFSESRLQCVSTVKAACLCAAGLHRPLCWLVC